MNPEAADLSRLHDLVVPVPASWWPPASGWYCLAILLFLAGIFRVLRFLLYWQRNRYRREALAELNRSDIPPAKMAEILKRTALSAFPRERVACLTGAQWLLFLDQSAGMTVFSTEAGSRLAALIYNPRLAPSLAEAEKLEWKGWMREWICEHDPNFEQKRC